MSARWRADLVALLVAGCGSGGGGMPMPCTIGHATFACGSDPACACSPGVDAPPIASRNHVPIGTPVCYPTAPPAGGDHYPTWHQPWGESQAAIQTEFWVHNLEHGGVVLLYDCPSGCDPELAQLRAVLSGTPPDRYNEVRILLSPAANLAHRFAAVAWGYRWQGDTVDMNALRCFIGARYDKAPESIP